MNYNTVETVIDALISKFRLQDYSYEIEEFVESIGRGLRHIGAAKVFEDTIAYVPSTGNMVRIPKDCLQVKGITNVGIRYTESGSFLEVDVADGTQIGIVYQALPVDSRGWPLVPDNVAVEEALIWYLAKDLILQGEIKTVGYDFAEAEWQWRCGSARANLNIMQTNDWSTVATNFTRLNPLKDQHFKQYSGMNKPNTLNRDKDRS